MIPYGIGTDIIEIERIREAIAEHGDAFINRIFTPAEQAYCKKHRDPIPHYAARFSAKESIVKALGCGIGEHISWHDIDISHDPAGKPLATLSPAAEKRFNHPRLLISMSHCKAYVSSIALVFHTHAK